VGALNDLAKKYEGKVDFLLVYIREAHPTDGWQVPQNERDGVLLPEAKSSEQKEDHASSCVRKLDIRFPALIDGMDNKVQDAYAGWPDRLYLVGKNGRIAFKGPPGPRGFQPPALAAAIEKELAR
jgi:hypothetical protein